MSISDFFQETIRAGETILVSGKRGSGKTALAISMCQHALNGDWGHENISIITNVLFGKVRAGQPPAEAYPPGVYHEDTLAGTMKRIGQIVDEYGSGNSTIIWLLDEAQNFMLADLNGSKENIALTKYLGNARKFDVCNMFLTPAVNNLTPRVRCFPTGETKSGYCSCQIYKDTQTAKMLVSGNMDPRSVSFVRMAADEEPQPIYVKPTPWIRGIYAQNATVGDFGYDTKSTATFSVGENAAGQEFSFEKFIRATSGGLSHQLPDRINSFFEKWESSDSTDLPGEDYSALRIRDQCMRIDRMRENGVRWSDVALYEGEIETTLKSRYQKFFRTQSSNIGESSYSTNDEGGRARAVYIKPSKKRGEEKISSGIVGKEAEA